MIPLDALDGSIKGIERMIRVRSLTINDIHKSFVNGGDVRNKSLMKACTRGLRYIRERERLQAIKAQLIEIRNNFFFHRVDSIQ